MYLALHFTVHGARARDGVGKHLLSQRLFEPPFLGCTLPGFFVFYNSIFAMFCPLWEGETELSGLRMVRALASSMLSGLV